MKTDVLICRDCLGPVEEDNGNFVLQICSSCNEQMLIEEGDIFMEKFTFFWQDQSPFSQFHPTLFKLGDLLFTCAEQYMMFKKAEMMGDKATAAEIMATPYNPKRYKALGRQVKPFNKELWDKKCKDVVYQGNFLKFTQNPKLLHALYETAGTTLVEASPFDAIWGIKLGPDHPDRFDRSKWKGKNWLGEVLTQLRTDLMTGERV